MDPQERKKRMLPNEQIRSILKDYKEGNRSINRQYEPPYNKIKEYKVKTFELEDPSKVIEEFII